MSSSPAGSARRSFAGLLLLLPLLALCGCFDYTEEVFVHADGSGRLRLDFGLLREIVGDEQALEEMRTQMRELARELEARPDVTKVVVSDEARGPLHHFVIDTHVARYQAIPTVLADAEADALGHEPRARSGGSPFRFEELEDGRIRYVRLLTEDEQMTVRSRTQAFLARTRTAGARSAEAEPVELHATFRVHAPSLESETAVVDGGSATWRFGLDDEPAVERLEAVLDLRRDHAVLLLGIGVGALAALAFLWLRKRWRRRWA